MSGTEKRFYGRDSFDTVTYLEFGSKELATGQKQVWDYREHQDAYDFFMLARYMKDLVTFRSLRQILQEGDPGDAWDDIWSTYDRDVYTADFHNSFTKLAALHVCHSDNPSFFELGSTLFGAIDALLFLQEILESVGSARKVDLSCLEYFGLDISRYLNRVAEEIHPDYRITTFEERSQGPDAYGVFFAKGVSLLYAIDNVESLASLLGRAECAVFDYSFVLGEPQNEILGTGKSVVKLSYAAFSKELERSFPGKSLFIETNSARYNKETRQLRANFLLAEPVTLQGIVREERELKQCLLEERALSKYRKPMFASGESADQYTSIEAFLESLNADSG